MKNNSANQNHAWRIVVKTFTDFKLDIL